VPARPNHTITNLQLRTTLTGVVQVGGQGALGRVGVLLLLHRKKGSDNRPQSGGHAQRTHLASLASLLALALLGGRRGRGPGAHKGDQTNDQDHQRAQNLLRDADCSFFLPMILRRTSGGGQHEKQRFGAQTAKHQSKPTPNQADAHMVRAHPRSTAQGGSGPQQTQRGGRTKNP
jgi:hypothetical protein